MTVIAISASSSAGDRTLARIRVLGQVGEPQPGSDGRPLASGFEGEIEHGSAGIARGVRVGSQTLLGAFLDAGARNGIADQNAAGGAAEIGICCAELVRFPARAERRKDGSIAVLLTTGDGDVLDADRTRLGQLLTETQRHYLSPDHGASAGTSDPS